MSFERPYIGASPDGIVECNCCNDKVILEVKCPHCIKDGVCEDEDREFCMEKVDECNWKLKRNHCYYYQVQAQMNVCNIANADFVVWTEKNIIIERIKIDKEFFDNECIKVEHFFVYGILPELLGKWFTRKNVANEKGVVPILQCSTSSQSDQNIEEDMDKPWCYCGTPCSGKMIMCDNSDCAIQWFHFDCLRIRCPPKGKWYCPSCTKLTRGSRKKDKAQ